MKYGRVRILTSPTLNILVVLVKKTLESLISKSEDEADQVRSSHHKSEGSRWKYKSSNPKTQIIENENYPLKTRSSLKEHRKSSSNVPFLQTVRT